MASLSLFYRYYFGHCSDELATCIPTPMAKPRFTWEASFAHNYCVELSNARIIWFIDDFFPSTSRLWNCLPSVFLASFNLPSFKRQVYQHLRDQMPFFFFFFFTFFRYFINLLFSLAFLFRFLRDADLRKGTLCPFCVPFHKKKKKKKNHNQNCFM